MQHVSFIALVLLYLFGASISYISQPNNLPLDLGSERGLTEGSTLAPDYVQKILDGANQGVPDSIYHLGLLKLYGISLSKNETVAMQHFQRAAELSLPYAMTAYAMMLMEGIGVSVDVNTAQIWLKKAIELEDPNAQWLLGKIYMEGRNLAGGPRFHEAFDLLHESASKGISQAQHLMALMHEYGLGVPQNFDEAMRWYNEASQNSNIESMYNLALMYTYGRGTDQDFRKASSLFDKAARLNHAASIYYIGLFKLYGYGCEPDYDRALHWFERAVGSTDEEIRKKALMAAKELRALLKIANEKNDAIAEKFRSMSEARGDL